MPKEKTQANGQIENEQNGHFQAGSMPIYGDNNISIHAFQSKDKQDQSRLSRVVFPEHLCKVY